MRYSWECSRNSHMTQHHTCTIFCPWNHNTMQWFCYYQYMERQFIWLKVKQALSHTHTNTHWLQWNLSMCPTSNVKAIHVHLRHTELWRVILLTVDRPQCSSLSKWRMAFKWSLIPQNIAYLTPCVGQLVSFITAVVCSSTPRLSEQPSGNVTKNVSCSSR